MARQQLELAAAVVEAEPGADQVVVAVEVQIDREDQLLERRPTDLLEDAASRTPPELETGGIREQIGNAIPVEVAGQQRIGEPGLTVAQAEPGHLAKTAAAVVSQHHDPTLEVGAGDYQVDGSVGVDPHQRTGSGRHQPGRQRGRADVDEPQPAVVSPDRARGLLRPGRVGLEPHDVGIPIGVDVIDRDPERRVRIGRLARHGDAKTTAAEVLVDAVLRAAAIASHGNVEISVAIEVDRHSR